MNFSPILDYDMSVYRGDINKILLKKTVNL